MKRPDFKELKKEIRIVIHFIKLTNRISKTYLPLLILSSVMKATTPFLNIIMPKFIIDELLGLKRTEFLLYYVGITVLGNGIINIITRFLDTKVDIANFAMVNGIELHMGKHIMNLDYESIENPEILDLKEKALFPINNQGVLWRMFGNLINLLQSIITIIGLIAIVATINIYLILAILAILFINTAIFKKEQEAQYKFYQELIPLNRIIGYYISLMTDFSMAKDMRIYHMSPYIHKRVDNFNEKSLDKFWNLFTLIGKYEGISRINLQIQMIAVYAYMVWKVVDHTIGIGSFTMYIAAANNFSTCISKFLTDFVELRQLCQYLELYMQFEQIPVKSQEGTKLLENTSQVTIEFRKVSFRYPRSTEYTLKEVSLKIQSGEKLSIVGQNGAGKTTFIKLLCRLYEPEEGEILINGTNIKEYSFQEYKKLLSVVFQDFKLFAFTVKENIVFDDQPEETLLKEALQKSGVYDKIMSLDRKMETPIYKTFEKDGIELSGGENQKLAIARAIYRDSPLVILDEPTAALDPYAEFEIYSRFNEMVKNKTAVYISHRMSSCRFCDKVAVFDQGRLVEYGTHSELEQKGGLYSKMWHTQAQYYAS